MSIVFRDFGTAYLAAPLAIGGLTITVDSPASLPVLQAGDYFYLVLQKYSDRSYVEIVKVTATNGAVFTIQRGQSGTTPRVFAAGDYAELRLTTDALTEYTLQNIATKMDKSGGGDFNGIYRFLNPSQSRIDVVRVSDSLALSLVADYSASEGHRAILGGLLGPNAVTPSILLRPKGYTDSTGQLKLDSAGLLDVVDVKMRGSQGLFPGSAVRLDYLSANYIDKSDAEVSSGKVMRVNGFRDQQIANALANTTGGAYVSETPPVGPFQGMRWFNTKIGRTFIYYIDGVGGQWVEENPQSPDWLTTSPVLSGIAHETTMLSNRNLLINGDFRVHQRGGSFNLAQDASTFCADRWRVYNNSSGEIAGGMIPVGADSPCGTGLQIIDKIGGKSIPLRQRVESINAAQVPVGVPITLSCWVNSVQGPCTVDLKIGMLPNGADNFTITNYFEDSFSLPEGGDGKWQRISVTTITPSYVRNGFNIGVNVSGLATNTYILFTGFQLELGEVATPFEHRPYGTELALCQRYYRGPFTYHTTNHGDWWATFVVPTYDMRTIPSLVGGVRVKDGSMGTTISESAFPVAFGSDGSGWFNITSMPNKPAHGGWVALYFRGFDAEL